MNTDDGLFYEEDIVDSDDESDDESGDAYARDQEEYERSYAP